MKLFVVDINYSDGSMVRLHRQALNKTAALTALATEVPVLQRPPLTILSILIFPVEEP